MTDDEIALHAAINVLEDSIECGRMPSGLPLEPDVVKLHKLAVERLRGMLAAVPK